MTVVVPADPVATDRLLPQGASWDGPISFRLNRNEVPVVFDGSYAPVIGKALTRREGQDETLVCCGLMVSRALEAAIQLERRGILTRVLEVHTVKPIDRAAIVRAASDTRGLVTVEGHTGVGGLGSAVAEVISAKFPVPLRRVGLRDRFAESKPFEALLERYELSVASMVRAAESAIAARRG
jgi:transketolase